MNRADSYRFDASEDDEDEEEVSPCDANTQNLLDNLLKEYLNRLESQPLKTKSITCAIVSALGALLGNLQSKGTRNNSNAKNSDHSALHKISEIIAFAVYGGLVGGPLTHYWNQWLDSNSEKSATSASWNMILDQLVAQPPMLFVMHVLLDMTGSAIREIPRAWNRSLARTGPSVVLNWRFWPAAVYLV
jgi:hypothetical protein